MNEIKNRKNWLEKVEKTLKIGGKSKKTFENYKSHINRFLNYFEEENIKQLKEDKIADFILENYVNLKKHPSTINVAVCSIKYFYSVCFNKSLNKNLLPNYKMPKKTPAIITKVDFVKIFNEETHLKYKCWLLLGFCCGLRVSEIATIKIDHIYTNEHKLKVIGKGNKERFTILPDIVIKYLRIYCKQKKMFNKKGYLFKGAKGLEHLNCKSITNYFTLLKPKYNLNNDITTHSLRHSFATYYLMNGGNIITLKSMMGHTNLGTTGIYIHIAQNFNELEGINYV